MLTSLTRVKLVVFALLAVLAVGYTGVHYARIGWVAGEPGYYVVTVNLPSSGGLYPGADVTYRGAPVGRVGALSLAGNGVRASLDINSSAPPIPARAQAVVADLSAVGEQYLDLRPVTSAGPYLTAGSVIGQQETQVPPPVTDMLAAVDALANSLPKASLRTLVDELDAGFSGQGANLQLLLNDASSFTRAAASDITPTSELISEGRSVLATQQAESTAIEQFATDGSLFAGQLASSDSDLRRLISSAPAAATQVSGLLADNDPDLGLTIANLVSVAGVAEPRQAALRELLSALPAVVAAGNTVVTKNGGSFGLSLTFFNPLPCTSGYQGSSHENGLDTTPSRLNISAGCTSPASSGIDVRGSQNAPAP